MVHIVTLSLILAKFKADATKSQCGASEKTLQQLAACPCRLAVNLFLNGRVLTTALNAVVD